MERWTKRIDGEAVCRFEAEDFGKSVFTTREEAEAALKEQEG